MRLKGLLVLAGFFLLAHALCMFLMPAHSAAISYPFVVAAPLLAFLGCSRHVRLREGASRVSWTLVALSLLIWCSGMLVLAWEELLWHVSPEIASFSDFNLFIYGVPILFAISTPTRRDSIPFLVWLDGAQAMLTAYLIYVAFFSVSPFTHKPIQPIAANRLVLIYGIEGFALACGASLRLLVQRRQSPTFQFYKVLTTYLWIYAVSIGLLNHAYLTRSGDTGYFDLLIDIPFLYLALAAGVARRQTEDRFAQIDRRPLILFVDNMSPIFFTVALFGLCLFVIRSHFTTGIASLTIALAVYAVRQTVLQNRYMRTQQELLETRDQMELASLTDSLTGIANRRAFDRTLEDEWDRAVRTKQPLSLLLVDADHFKSLNDRHGHQYGDDCLRKIAQGMRSALPRSGDLLARYGGEEFVVLLPTTGREGAESVSTRVRQAVQALRIKHESPTGQFATISVGIAVAEFPTTATLDDLIKAADVALYSAKQNGRNQMQFAPILCT